MREQPLEPPKLSRRRKRGLTNENKTFMDVQRCKRAMFLFDTGCTTKHIMRDLQISEKSVRKFKNQYEFTGTIQPTFGMFKKPIRSQRQVMETIAAKEALTKLVRENCSLTLGAMKEALQKLGIKRQAATIHKYLKQLRYSRKKIRKVPIERNTKEKLVFRQKYCRMISQIPLQNLVFLDQTSFHQHTSQNFGWAPKGQYAAIHLPAHKKQVVTLLAAISIKGFEATKIIRGPITCKHITEFIEHYLDHLQPHEVLIMDNARVHHAAPVKQKIAQLKRPVRFLPAYTPQLNPIQSVFGQIKNQFKKRRNHATMKITQVQQLIQQSVQNLKSKNFKTYFQHYTQWVKKGIAGQLFI